MKFKIKSFVLRTLALILAVLPPAFAVITYFPIWKKTNSSSVISGFALLLLLICAVPIFKYLKKKIKSPTALGIWFCIFVMFFLLSEIADEMCVISFTGFVGNLLAAFLWRTEKKLRARALKQQSKNDA